MSGKGSAPRPFSVDHDTYSTNWDSIFRKDAGAKDGPTIEGAKAQASSNKQGRDNECAEAEGQAEGVA